MKIKPVSLVQRISHQLSSHFDKSESKAIAMMLLQEFLSLDRAKLIINDELDVAENILLLLDQVVDRLNKHEPVQHIIGKGHFYGRDFKVGPDVLIPRPETEELVDLITRNHREQTFKLIDIGTGTGCIPITLSLELEGCQATGVDVSEQALAIAKLNANQLRAAVNFLELDILNEVPAGTYDVVVSNPPYITHAEKKLMHENVLQYEPGLALFVPDEQPLLFYERITSLCQSILKPGGFLYFEINEHFGEQTLALLDQGGFTGTRLIEDLSGKHRIIMGRKP
ncbi:MAG: peptide chain release factor N(5)-glutamine methyltransferase [Bacteroidota bacterium]